MRELLARGEGQEYLLPQVYGYILMNRAVRHPRGSEAAGASGAAGLFLLHGSGPSGSHMLWAWRRRRCAWPNSGAQTELARHAGILHDCTKYLELVPQLHLCEKYGIPLDDLEQKAVKLLHSKTGACIAKYIFGEPDEVYEAIFWHTTGRANMTLLDKILYMADYIEQTGILKGGGAAPIGLYRSGPGHAAGGGVHHPGDGTAGVPIHKNTLAARDWLRKHG